MAPDPEQRAAFIRDFYKRKDFTGWFDVLYEKADGNPDAVPWARSAPNALLVEWLEREGKVGDGKRAIVVGCGLGDDAEALAQLGFVVTAFDISPKAIVWCKERFPDSSVDYQAADLFDLPSEWGQGFDFVFESLTIQSLPLVIREDACRKVASLVAPDGELLLICFGREHDEPTPHIPFPLSKDELATIPRSGLVEKHFEDIQQTSGNRGALRWFRVLYQRPK